MIFVSILKLFFFRLFNMSIQKYFALNMLALLLAVVTFRLELLDSVAAQVAIVLTLALTAAAGVLRSSPTLTFANGPSVYETLLKTLMKTLGVLYVFAAAVIAFGIDK